MESLDFGAIARQLLVNVQHAHAKGLQIETVFLVFELSTEEPGHCELEGTFSVLRICGTKELKSTSTEDLLPLIDGLLMSESRYADRPLVAGILVNESNGASLGARVTLASHDSIATFRIEPSMQIPLLAIQLKSNLRPPADV